MRAATGYGAIAFLTGGGLLGLSGVTGFEGLRIAATLLLAGAAICIAIAAAVSSNTAVWLERMTSLFSRSLGYVAVAALVSPALIALILSLTKAVIGSSDRAALAVVSVFIGLSLLAVMACAATTALAALHGRKTAMRSENRE